MNPLPTDTTATASGALDEFLERYEAAQTPAELLEAWCRAWPELAPRLRALAAQSDRLRAAAATPAPRLSAGQSLGPFCIVREIATGGMGVIYEARQVGLERRVALKTIRSDRASEAARERFVREQQALALLHHTHIVPVFASGVEGDLHYYGMQFIEGVTLHTVIQRLRRGGLAAWRAGGAGFWPAIHEPSSPESLPQKFPLSYFRFAASIVAQAAEAVHSAHERQVIHRDLKPANLMLDEQGKCWLIDFGLARVPASHLASALPAEGDALDVECAAMTQQALGTQPYMSPEHFELLADERSDVWGLGVILYELLTLRRAFPAQTSEASRKLIEANAPTPPSQLVRNVPATLAAIFTRATQSAPAERYASAQELADDLRNWLDHKPTRARRILAPESLWLWAKRNPGRAIASGMAGLMACAALVALFMALSARANFLATRANAAIERARLAEQGSRDKEREILMRDLVTLRLSTHTDGWTKKADELIARIAPLGVDEELRTQAASCLMGMDARHVAGFTDAPAWFVALSPDGAWMLSAGPREDIPVRLVEIATNRVVESQLRWSSLATFLPDGTPLQIALPTATDPRFQFWDVRQQQLLGELSPPEGWTTDGLAGAVSRDGARLAIAGQCSPLAPRAETHRIPHAPPTDNDNEVGVSPAIESDPLKPQPRILVIDLLKREIICRVSSTTTALALADEGQLLAIGSQNGTVEIRSLPDSTPLREIVVERARITALDLCRSPLVPRNGARPALRWYLAVAASGGSLAVWNLESGTLVNQFRGSPHGLHAVALSHDGATLASCGRNEPRVWDVGSGRLLLHNKYTSVSDWNQGIRFAPTGSLLAVSRAAPGGGTEGAIVSRLSEHRGISVLRGLDSGALKVWLSSDDTLVAALSHTWQLGVWDVKAQRLLHVFETHQGRYSDNAAVAFSPDNRQLAFATQGAACLWDLQSQQIAAQWQIGTGFCEDLAYSARGELLLVRADRENDSPDSPRQGQFAGRVYELQVGAHPRVRAEYHGCRAGIYSAVISPQGDYVVFDGRTSAEQAGRTVTAIDTTSGDVLWSYRAAHPLHHGHLVVNRTGTLIMSYGVLDHRPVVINARTGEIVHASDKMVAPFWLTSDGRWVFRDGTVLEMGDATHAERALFAADTSALHGEIVRAEFSQDNYRLAWGNNTGEVLVADIPQIVESLGSRGLGTSAPPPTGSAGR